MDNFDPQKVYTDAIKLYQNKKYQEKVKPAGTCTMHVKAPF